MSLGGSTNAIIHLTAIAGRLGIKVDLREFNKISNKTPVLVDLKPTGKFYMEDFYHAGGMKALLKELKPLLKLGTSNIEGKSLSTIINSNSKSFHDQNVIRSRKNPLKNMVD